MSLNTAERKESSEHHVMLRRAGIPIFRPEWIIATLFLGCVVLVSLACTRSGLRSSNAPYYELYAEGIRHGHLWLEALPASGECRWDLSRFEGKCYAYWGLLPALVHVGLPFASDRFLAMLGFTVAVLFLTKLVLLLSKSSEPIPLRRSVPVLVSMVAVSMVPATAVVARIYEEAIGFGAAFGLAGLYYVISGMDSIKDGERALTRRIWGGITLLSVASLARLPWLGVAGAALLYWLITVGRGIGLPHSKDLFKAALPIVSACLIAASVNVVRFHDPFDFGFSTITSNRDMLASGVQPSSPVHIFDNIMMYLFAGLPPMRIPTTATAAPGGAGLLAMTRYFTVGQPYQEYALALFPGMPMLILSVPALRRRTTDRQRTIVAVLLTLIPSLAVLSIAGSIYRYELEAVLPMLLLLTPQALHLAKQASSTRIAWLWGLTGVGLLLSGANSIWVIRTICEWWKYC